MADAVMLENVKAAIGITGTYMDATISLWIDEVCDYMIGAGVSTAKLSASVGVISRGVNDLWNNGAGDGKLSPYFYDRVTQLVYRTKYGGGNI